MSKSAVKASVAEAFLMSVLSGLAITLGGAALVACFYFFDPMARPIIVGHVKGLLIVGVVVFLVGFLITLESTLWVGSWGTNDDKG